MNKYKFISLLIILVYIVSLSILAMHSGPSTNETTGEAGKIVLEFYYEDGCPACESIKPTIEKIEDDYANNQNVTITRKPVTNDDYRKEWRAYQFKTIPSVVLKNTSVNSTSKLYKKSITLLDTEEFGDADRFEYRILDLTYKNLKNEIEYHLTGNYSQQTLENESDTKVTTIFGSIDYSKYSLPVITIILAAADSVNPCSFFILLFLLSMLLHTGSRKRMLLVGGIFIFFSGFIYFLLMLLISEIKDSLDSSILAIVAGTVAILFGILNIKDFFYFKKGVSASIPESQKSKLYKQMRTIVKISSLPSLIAATIIFAVSANTVELLCSLGLPLVYTGTILPLFNLSSFETYLYLFFYNVIYIIPLLIIVLIVIMTLGRWKLSEFQGQLLKLFSGLMILSLGIVLILRIGLLQNMFFTIGILSISLFLTVILSLLWKEDMYYGSADK